MNSFITWIMMIHLRFRVSSCLKSLSYQCINTRFNHFLFFFDGSDHLSQIWIVLSSCRSNTLHQNCVQEIEHLSLAIEHLGARHRLRCQNLHRCPFILSAFHCRRTRSRSPYMCLLPCQCTLTLGNHNSAETAVIWLQ